MLYNTTITSCEGGVYVGSNGERLISIGRQNVYVGKNVYTDGKIIYGYDIPQMLQRKVIRKKKKKNDIIVEIYNRGYDGYFSGVVYRKPDKYTENYNYGGVYGRLTVPVGTDWALAAGNKLYYIVEDSSTTTSVDANGEEVTTINNTITIGDVNGEEVTINDNWSYRRYFGAAGANGGIIITGYASSSGYSGDIVYISPDMREHRVYSRSGSGSNWTFINAVGHFNVNDEGEATCTVQVMEVNDYDEKTEIKTLKFNSSGGYQMISYTNPVLGDGIGHFERSGNTVSNNGTITFEFDDGQGGHRTLTLPITNGYTSSVVGDYVFIYSLSPIDIKQYDKNNGNLLRDYSTGIGSIYNLNNLRIIGCDPVKLFRQWGFVEN